MKTALTELIERLEEKIKICSSNNLEREAMGMIEAKAIATELLQAMKNGEQGTKTNKMKDEKDLEYWKNNCEEEYRNTPICVLRYITELEKSIEFTNQSNQQSEVDHVKDFHTWRLPNEQPTKTVEERALELYPDKPTMDIQGWGKLQLAEYERAAYIKGATDNQNK